MVEAAAVCVDCGARMLRLEPERRGVSVIVTGPGEVGDKLDAFHHVALFEILDELPAQSVPAARGRRQAPRVPFYLARGLTRASADELTERLQARYFVTEIEPRRTGVSPQMRTKLWRMAGRYMAGFGGLAFLVQSINLIPRAVALWAYLGVLATSAGALVASALRSTRPVVPRRRIRRPRVGGVDQLAVVLPRLKSRQDRRLGGRILERLDQIETFERTDATAALATRAARVAEALVSLETRREHDASAPPTAGTALEELRREETMRVVLRTDLLRAASRLDRMILAITRAKVSGSSDEIGALDEQIRELATAVDAEQEIKGLLEEKP